MKSNYTKAITGGVLALLVAMTGSLYAGPGRDGDRVKRKNQGDGAPWMKDGAGEKGVGEHRGRPERPSREEILKKFDANQDGKLDDDEKAAMQKAREKRAAEMKAKMIETFDKDGDGKLNEEERVAAREARPRMQGKNLPEHVIEKFDKDGDGKLNEAEREAARAAHEEHMQERRQKMLEKFDADGDGELNKEEKAAMHKFMKEHGPKKGPRGKKRDGKKAGAEAEAE